MCLCVRAMRWPVLHYTDCVCLSGPWDDQCRITIVSVCLSGPWDDQCCITQIVSVCVSGPWDDQCCITIVCVCLSGPWDDQCCITIVCVCQGHEMTSVALRLCVSVRAMRWPVLHYDCVCLSVRAMRWPVSHYTDCVCLSGPWDDQCRITPGNCCWKVSAIGFHLSCYPILYLQPWWINCTLHMYHHNKMTII